MGSNRSITYITDICSRKELRIFKIWILWFGSKCRVSRCTQQSWLFPRPFALSNFSRSSGFMLCRIERAHLLILLEDFLPQSRNPCEPLSQSPSFIYVYISFSNESGWLSLRYFFLFFNPISWQPNWYTSIEINFRISFSTSKFNTAYFHCWILLPSHNYISKMLPPLTIY